MALKWLLGLVLLAIWRAEAQILEDRGVPDQPKDVKTIKSPNGATIRYKEPEICETTPGVKSYSGYIDIREDIHIFFWFFESRRDPANDPVTLWQNGGPGADSLLGLFEEIGPCYVSNDTLKTHIREYSWSNTSNLLIFSQPLGTGFSYSTKEEGYLDEYHLIRPEKIANHTTEKGRFGKSPYTANDTATLAADTAWEVLQGLYGALPSLTNDKVKSTDFIFWAESYGGHLGPAFATKFYEENQKIEEQKLTGRKLNFKVFGIVNGWIDMTIQEKHLLEFTQNNTYGVKLINDTIYDHGKFAMYREGGCQDSLNNCQAYNYYADDSWKRYSCAAAQFICQNSVESLYYTFGEGRGVYDIRNCSGQGRDVPPHYGWKQFLNTSDVQNALGVDLNYTTSQNYLVYNAFNLAGDFALSYLPQIEEMLSYPDIQIAFMYGDADYICAWTGGEDVSLTANWTGTESFRKAGYAKLVVDGKEYGEVRQYGRFSFTRVWESGHEVPWFQPEAAFAIFNRTGARVDVATGTKDTRGNSSYASEGPGNSTYMRIIEQPLECPEDGREDYGGNPRYVGLGRRLGGKGIPFF
ncbi:Carboxypeptidase Y-like [Pseudocercospora fuligena]|uniref:Carboxypeptidase Y-like n=1 Tax=Pseudocercospora fuligena TaxID=685502 RepID=A0A8H6RT66_9PEZI|nr:Carboxypeptidase Y-like [Pseudocercospora fuligena]